MFIFAFFVNMSLAVIDFLNKDRSLPYEYCLPFDWRRSPIYEILFPLQIFVASFIPFSVIESHDVLFAALCSNCSAQFRLLRTTLQIIGTGREDDVIRKLWKLPGVDVVVKKEWQKEKTLLVICIKHHQKLLG